MHRVNFSLSWDSLDFCNLITWSQDSSGSSLLLLADKIIIIIKALIVKCPTFPPFCHPSLPHLWSVSRVCGTARACWIKKPKWKSGGKNTPTRRKIRETTQKPLKSGGVLDPRRRRVQTGAVFKQEAPSQPCVSQGVSPYCPQPEDINFTVFVDKFKHRNMSQISSVLGQGASAGISQSAIFTSSLVPEGQSSSSSNYS